MAELPSQARVVVIGGGAVGCSVLYHLAKGAREQGARIVRFRPVTGARRGHGEWVFETSQGEVRCEFVVNAAGYRAAEVGALSGGYGHRVRKSIALCALKRDRAEAGRELEIDILGERRRAVVSADRALYDPENSRLRG